VLARLFAIDQDVTRGKGHKRLCLLADHIVDARDPGAWNQALMELGATVCTPRSPSCKTCPVAAQCRARAENRQAVLPVVAPKKKPKSQRVQALVATRGGKVLLVRRRAEGLFGGLWEPPSADGDARANKALCARFPVGDVERRGRVTHVLTHRRLAIDVLRAACEGDPLRAELPACYDAAKLVYPDKLETLGVATLTKKVLAVSGLVG